MKNLLAVEIIIIDCLKVHTDSLNIPPYIQSDLLWMKFAYQLLSKSLSVIDPLMMMLNIVVKNLFLIISNCGRHPFASGSSSSSLCWWWC